jgi:DNA-binding response OmpR family regulator
MHLMGGPRRVLVVDDDPVVRGLMARYLERDGFEVHTVSDGAAALGAYRPGAFDLLLLDVMLPEVDGMEILRRVRRLDSVPVIVLTAKVEEGDRILGLELGADDYVVKPFSPAEVVARVRAVLRRATDPSDQVIQAGPLRIDPRSREVSVRGKTVPLTPKEFEVLHLLASNPRCVFRRRDLLEELWDFAYEGTSDTVTVHIRRLREKIERDPSDPKHLVTVWGVGYRFDP